MHRAFAIVCYILAVLGVAATVYALVWPTEELDRAWAMTTLVFAGLLVFLGYRIWTTAPGAGRSPGSEPPAK